MVLLLSNNPFYEQCRSNRNNRRPLGDHNGPTMSAEDLRLLLLINEMQSNISETFHTNMERNGSGPNTITSSGAIRAIRATFGPDALQDHSDHHCVSICISLSRARKIRDGVHTTFDKSGIDCTLKGIHGEGGTISVLVLETLAAFAVRLLLG